MFSIDFLVGFTIFMVALIAVASMVPGLLAGLQSSGIDYDAVAYRTGVILVEDPGWPVDPPWETYDENHKDEIERIGLAVSRDAPNILLSTKIEKFFNTSFFDPEDYRSKAIFGDIPYSYNITLRSLDAEGTYNYATGDDTPPGYGYIRRVVKIKEPSVAVIDGSFKDQYTTDTEDTSTSRNFTVRFDFNRLITQSIDPAYRIDPRAEPVNITITDFGEFLNGTASYATLESVTFRRGSSSIPFPYDESDTDYYTLRIDNNPVLYSPEPGVGVSSSISLVLKPPATSLFNLGPTSILDVEFKFEDEPPATNITGIHYYDYNPTNVTRPDLKPAVLEVAIW